jgi:hypothetical protein
MFRKYEFLDPDQGIFQRIFGYWCGSGEKKPETARLRENAGMDDNYPALFMTFLSFPKPG